MHTQAEWSTQLVDFFFTINKVLIERSYANKCTEQVKSVPSKKANYMTRIPSKEVTMRGIDSETR